MNRLVFTIALPVMLFRNVYQADFAAIFDLRFIFWILASIFLCFTFIWVVGEIYLRKQPHLIGAFVQGAFRCNYAIVGLTLADNILGDTNTGLGALAAAFVVTSYNVGSVVVLTVKDPDKGKINLSLIKDMTIGVCKNPSVIGIALGVLVGVFEIPLPIIAQEGVNYIAALCSPIALLAIGASIRVQAIMQCLKPALVASAFKIIISPLIFVTVSVWLGFRYENLVVLFVMFANPTAIMSYVMAARMNGDTTLTSAIILITTVCSVFTMTVGVYVLRTLALI